MRIYLLFFVFFLIGCGKIAVKTENKQFIIPQYFYNYNLWNKIIYAEVGGYVIINPSDGPGDNTDSAYFNEINELIDNGKIPIGYVSSNWANKDIKEILKDIDKWIELYPNIKGFFIDEVSTLKTWFYYYDDIVKYIRSKGNYKIVLNPGTMPDAVYFSIADVIIVYEGEPKNLPKNVCAIYPSKSAVVIYNASISDMRKILLKPCKYFYITDDNDSNPFDTLPSYFDEEIELLK
jgi:hypothetical protein